VIENAPAMSACEAMMAARVAMTTRGIWAEIVQDEGREDDEAPGGPDGLLSEVPHVRIERFGPGDRQEDRAEDEDTESGVGGQQVQAFEGVEGP